MVTRRPDADSNDSPGEGALREALAQSEAQVDELSAKIDDLVAEGRDFLTEAAHTVRGALTITHSYLEILDTDLSEGLTEEQRSFIGIAYQNAEKLRRLIEELVELASLETAAAQIDVTPTDINQIVDNVREQLSHSAQEKALGLTLELAESLPKIEVDPRRLTDAIRRLVDNAIRFTPEGGSITLRSGADEEFVYIEVADTGLGIPAPRLADCMKPFGQAHRKPGENRVGYGLGLPLCRLQVEAIGGTLTLESVEDEGTNASIRFPLS